MARLSQLFVSTLYQAGFPPKQAEALNRELAAASQSIARDDRAGIAWSKAHAYPGYTSYASLNDLPRRASAFATLEALLLPHVKKFARAIDLDPAAGTPVLDSLWINILRPGGRHTAHIHPQSCISGTYYVRVPGGAGAFRLEDPRLAMMMAAGMRKENARIHNKPFVDIHPRAGSLLLWESYLRHEVLPNAPGRAGHDRISISFNYALR
ncbi:MAG TPA: TIGR02466 family protein [Micropepsaceae bacterium]|nr:TIGR02466 family protein [Micropepsaceae bacterium]